MELYLLTHGLALPPTEDPEQPLSRDGIDQVKAAAAVLKRLGIKIETLVASGEKRSRQSAALIAEGVNYPYSDIVETPLVAPEAKREDFAILLLPLLERPSVLIAGHRPSLGRLVGMLLAAPGKPLQLESGALGHWSISSLQPLEARMRSWLAPEQIKLMASSFGRG